MLYLVALVGNHSNDQEVKNNVPLTPLQSPFTVDGNWYRGCLHVHSTESDGSMPPERLLRHYQMGGFDFVAITDHEAVTDRSALTQSDFLVLRGIELSVGRAELGQTYHVVGVGFEEGFTARRGWTAQEAVDETNRFGGVAIVAHPYWSGLTAADLLAVQGYAAFEVYNAGCEGEIARGYAHYHWDELLTRGCPVRAVAADDSHWPGFDSLRAWTMVRARELTRSAIVEALREGHFYASTGPEIYSVCVEDDRVEVECSPVRSIAMVCDPTRGGRVGASRTEPPIRAQRRRGRQSYEGLDEAQPLTGAVFQLRGAERYARIQMVDAQGRMAWTNPLFTRG